MRYDVTSQQRESVHVRKIQTNIRLDAATIFQKTNIKLNKSSKSDSTLSDIFYSDEHMNNKYVSDGKIGNIFVLSFLVYSLNQGKQRLYQLHHMKMNWQIALEMHYAVL